MKLPIFPVHNFRHPLSGASFFAEFSHVDGVCFEQYLDWFSQAYPKQLHLIQLDNGRWHIWSELDIPDNVILIFQPPYTPYAKRYPLGQVNTIERLWKEIKKRENPLRGSDAAKAFLPLRILSKKHRTWELFDNLDRLRAKLFQVLSRLTQSAIASITGWDFILDALFVANI